MCNCTSKFALTRPGMTSYCCFAIGGCRTSENITRELPDQGAGGVGEER